MRLEDKVVIITGAGTGIGRGCALAFAEEGAKIVAAGRRLGPIRGVIRDIEKNGGRGVYQQTDVSKKEDVLRLIDRTMSSFGRIDVVFANAGVNPCTTNIVETSEEDWQTAIDINLTGVFLLCKYSIPHMMKNRTASIIVTSSQVGLVGQKNRIPYGATKGGLISLVRCMALDCAEFNIRVNAICPGRIRIKANADASDWAERAPLYPLGLRGTPDDVARAAIYLASDESAWVTGIALPVDGGFTVP
jgi:NAD(P)-dependent dehydrogenase (short-subunit alcohol dehydrogenase family)